MPNKPIKTRQAAEQLLAQFAEEDLKQLTAAGRRAVSQLRDAVEAEREMWHRLASARWSKLSPEQRRIRLASATAASPRNKPGRAVSPGELKHLARARANKQVA